MGLIYWLPMTDGTAKNQGLVNDVFTTHGPTANTSGKLGSCCYFNGSTHSIYTNREFDYPQTTISCWFKISPDNSVSGSQWLICFNNSGSGTAANTLTGFYITTAIKLVCQSRGRTYTCGVTLSKDVWYHVCATSADGETIKVYINGELVGEDTVAGTAVTATCLSIGGRSANSSGTVHAYCPTGMYMNDVRIYDNILSPREIKEISRGLVLHYPLSGSGGGCENLMKDSNFSITSGLNASTVKIATLIPVGTTITVSVQVDADDVVWDSSSNYRRVGTEFYAPKSGTTGNQYFGAWAGQELSSSGNVVEAFTGSFHGRVSKTFTTLGEVPALKNVGLYIQGVTSGTVRVSNPKAEIGSVATPWIPNAADTEYAALGFNDGIEYDVSGYEHNGTKTGTFAYDADTPRYNTSTIFNGNNHIAVGRLLITDELTYSWWAYSDNWGSSLGGSMVSSVEGGGMGHQNGGSTYLWFICGTGTSSNDYGSGYQMPTPSAGWHMFTETWDGFSFKVYIDGILKFTDARYTTKTPVYYAPNGNWLFVGGESSGSATTTADHFVGKLSDFRVYATALSADDVMALYHTPISLANNGTLLTQGEYVES